MSIDTKIGDLDWNACLNCKHYRAEEGGCEWLDKLGAAIFDVDFSVDWIQCSKFEDVMEGGGQ